MARLLISFCGLGENQRFIASRCRDTANRGPRQRPLRLDTRFEPNCSARRETRQSTVCAMLHSRKHNLYKDATVPSALQAYASVSMSIENACFGFCRIKARTLLIYALFSLSAVAVIAGKKLFYVSFAPKK